MEPRHGRLSKAATRCLQFPLTGVHAEIFSLNWNRLVNLRTAVEDGFKTLPEGNGRSLVANLTTDGITSVIVLALDRITRQFEPDVIPNIVRKFANHNFNFIPEQITKPARKPRAQVLSHLKLAMGSGESQAMTWQVNKKERSLWADC